MGLKKLDSDIVTEVPLKLDTYVWLYILPSVIGYLKDLGVDKRKLPDKTWAEFLTQDVRLLVCFIPLTKTAQFKVENSAQTTFRFSPVSFCALGKYHPLFRF